MSTFHPFPRLPAELRLAIWDLIIEPREVEVRIVKPTYDDPLEAAHSSEPWQWDYVNNVRFKQAMAHIPTSTRAGRKARRKAAGEWKSYQPYVHLTSSSIPAILHACREARDHGLSYYQQVAMDVDGQNRADRRYIWLNLETDRIDIGTWHMAWFRPISASIKRLKLHRETPEEFDQELKLVSMFTNVIDIHFVCIDGFSNWDEEVDDVRWPCAREKLVFIDEDPWPGYGVKGPLKVDYRGLKKYYRRYWSAVNSAYDADWWGSGYDS